jgi:N-methylhydantoinase A
MAYAGQIHSLRVMIDATWDATRLEKAFNDVYRETFGNTLADMPVVIVNLRTVAIGKRSSAALPHSDSKAVGLPRANSRRQVHFNGWFDTPVYLRGDLAPGMQFDGPAIVEQSDTTTVVEPDMKVTVDAKGNLLVKLKDAP